MGSPARRRRLRALRISLALLGIVAGLELFLRIAGYYYRVSFWDSPQQRQAISSGAVTLLALGESTTAGIWLPIEDSYPKQLEHLLRAYYGNQRIRVLVPPHIGQNTSQMVHQFRQYLTAFQPVLVIIMAGVNNTWSLAESNLGDFMPPGDWRTRLFRLRRWTDDIKVVRLARLALRGFEGAWSRLRSDLEGKPLFTPWPPKGDPLVSALGPEPFLRLWRSDVDRMIGEARAGGSAVILMTYPNYETPPVSEFVTMSEKWSVPLVENHKSFDILIEQGRAREFFFDDLRHPNARGYAILANNVFCSIITTGALEKSLGLKRMPKSTVRNDFMERCAVE